MKKIRYEKLSKRQKEAMAFWKPNIKEKKKIKHQINRCFELFCSKNNRSIDIHQGLKLNHKTINNTNQKCTTTKFEELLQNPQSEVKRLSTFFNAKMKDDFYLPEKKMKREKRLQQLWKVNQ